MNSFLFWTVCLSAAALAYTPGCQYELGGSSGVVSSPLYPLNYYNNLDCSWLLTTSSRQSFLLTFKDFSLEDQPRCEYDYLEIFDGESSTSPSLGKFCGSNIPPAIHSNSNKVRIHLVTDKIESRRGFFLNYETTPKKCQVTLFHLSGTVYSPNYPNSLNGVECYVRVVLPRQDRVVLMVRDFQMLGSQSCSDSSVEVYDGPDTTSRRLFFMCRSPSSLPHRFVSSTNVLYFKIKTSPDHYGRGFYANYFADSGSCAERPSLTQASEGIQFGGLASAVGASSTHSTSMRGHPVIQPGGQECEGDVNGRYRTADGTCNNVLNFGSSSQSPRRLLPNAYDDGVNAPRTRSVVPGFTLPSAALVSRVVHPRNDVQERYTVMLMQWGQFIDHDITGFPVAIEEDSSIECCTEDKSVPACLQDKECFPIVLTPIDINKRFEGSCLEFTRSIPAKDENEVTKFPREQINSLTSFVDASMVYGNNLERQLELRETNANGSPSYLLRLNSTNQLLPRNPEQNCRAGSGSYCFLAGDDRVNEQPGLTTMHTIFALIHNFVAQEIRTRILPQASDEQVFQEARKIVAAIIQNILYGEWLPLILGPDNMDRYNLWTGSRTEYNPNVDPRITNAFATAAFRFGHSLIPSAYQIGNSIRPLRELFNNPDPLFENFVDMMKALVVQPVVTTASQTMDRFFTEEITGHLFEPENLPQGQPSRGLDLVALNIQRGRDHGLPPYNRYREFCGLSTLADFNDIQSPTAREALRSVYRSVDDIDLFSGLMTESRGNDQELVGSTLACLIGNQFHALKFGDRFYFETDSFPEGFTDDQLAAIRSVTLAQIFCLWPQFQQLQQNAFKVPKPGNPMVNCENLRESFLQDLNPWLSNTNTQSSDGQQQSFDGQQQSFDGQQQSFNGQQQSSDGQRQSSGGQRQSSGGQRQSFSGQRQSSSGQRQSSSGQRQSSGGQTHSSGSHHNHN